MTWSYIKGIEICGHKNDTEMLALHANLNGYITHGIDIEAELELMPRKPELVFLNETETGSRPSS